VSPRRLVLTVLVVCAGALLAPTQAGAASLRPFPDRVHDGLMADGGRIVVYRPRAGRTYRAFDTTTRRRRDWRVPRACAGRLHRVSGTAALFQCSGTRLSIRSTRTGRALRAPGLRALRRLPVCRARRCTLLIRDFGSHWIDLELSPAGQYGTPATWRGYVGWRSGALVREQGEPKGQEYDLDARRLEQPPCPAVERGPYGYANDRRWAVMQGFADVTVRHCSGRPSYTLPGNLLHELPHVAGALETFTDKPVVLRLLTLRRGRLSTFRLGGFSKVRTHRIAITRRHVIVARLRDHGRTRRVVVERVSWARLPG
jgi:hypothetical protein